MRTQSTEMRANVLYSIPGKAVKWHAHFSHINILALYQKAMQYASTDRTGETVLSSATFKFVHFYQITLNISTKSIRNSCEPICKYKLDVQQHSFQHQQSKIKLPAITTIEFTDIKYCAHCIAQTVNSTWYQPYNS